MRLEAEADDTRLLHWIAQAFRDSDGPVGIAVSGGGDSMALLHLAHRWSRTTGRPLAAVTVDHTLRDGSDREAAAVHEWCAAAGIDHTTLVWNTWDGHGNVQAAARTARYRLIADWADSKGIATLALGHTRDDAVETFLMRLARKAGIDGLAVMAHRFTRHDLTWLRPLWLVPRADLRAYLRRHEVRWIDDPSNDDVDFERIRIRKALDLLADTGLRPDALHHAAVAAAEARDALDHYTRQEARAHSRMDGPDLILTLPADLPAETARRLRAKAIQWMGRLDYPPRHSSMEHLMTGLALEGKHTLAGCLVTRDGNSLRLARELQAVRSLSTPTRERWDGKWAFDGPHADDLDLRPLGDDITQCPDWRATGLPRASLMAAPAVWQGDTLVAAPLAGHQNGWSARIVADFQSWLSAH